MDPKEEEAEGGDRAKDASAQEHAGSESIINVSTASAISCMRERPKSINVVSPPPEEEVPLHSKSESQLYRTASLPGGMNERMSSESLSLAHASSPVQMRMSTGRSRKKAQYLRNSVAVTNSDYLNQWKPHMVQLIRSQSPGGASGLMRAVPSAPSLDTISEHELVARFQPPTSTSNNSVLSPLVTKQQQADPSMFRYTPTPVLDPRQTVPRPVLSRPTTPVPPSMASSRATTPAVLSPNATGYYRPFSVLRESSQAVPFSSDVENQFLPVFINPETGRIYMFEDGYYVPVVPQQLTQLQSVAESAKTAVTQPPVPDKRLQHNQGRQAQAEQQTQRYSHLFQDVPDYLRFVQLLILLFAICCDFAVLLLCGLPALFCSIKVKKANSIGDSYQAKKYSEYTLCFAIGGIVFHIIAVLLIITMFLILHFIVNVFSS